MPSYRLGSISKTRNITSEICSHTQFPARKAAKFWRPNRTSGILRAGSALSRRFVSGSKRNGQHRGSSRQPAGQVRGNPPSWGGWSRSLIRAFETGYRSEEHTSELQSLRHLVCRLLLEKKKT